jgi:hypothetical protein
MGGALIAGTTAVAPEPARADVAKVRTVLAGFRKRLRLVSPMSLIHATLLDHHRR